MSLPSLTFNYVPSIGWFKCIHDSLPRPSSPLSYYTGIACLCGPSIIPPNELGPRTGTESDGPSTERLAHACFAKSATPSLACEAWPSSGLDPSSPTHLLEAVLVPGIIITGVVTGKVSGVDLDQRKGSEAKPHLRPPLLRAVPIPPAPQSLTLRTPNSPRTTRVRISSTACVAAIFHHSP